MIRKITLNMIICITLLNADDAALKHIFEKYTINGTLIISSLKSEEIYFYNKKRADSRFTAASTFKIPHTLIALNENLISSEKDTFKWDGVKRAYEPWNSDQTLQSAMAVSCVWCYQRFTNHISKEKYEEYLVKFNYGNKEVGMDKSSFWLDDSLKISAFEQIDFLKKFYTYNLPISHVHIDIVKKILTVEKNKQYEIKAKSGWDGAVGWYVGYVKTKDNIYFFAFNATIDKTQLPLRNKIVLEALKAKRIL